MVGTMHHRMTIETAPVESIYGIGGQVSRLMSPLHMALLAEARDLRDQHLVVGRAVGVVAGQAIFLNRRVLPKEGCFLLRMALETFVIEGLGVDQLFSLCAVCVMAGGAGHLAFTGGRR